MSEQQTTLVWLCPECNGRLTCNNCEDRLSEAWRRREAVWAKVLDEEIQARKAAEAALQAFVTDKWERHVGEG